MANRNSNNSVKQNRFTRVSQGRSSSFPPISKLLERRTPTRQNRLGAGKRISLDGHRDEPKTPADAASPRQRPMPPASLDAEHRGVMATTSHIMRDTRSFLTGLRPVSYNYEKFKTSALEILEVMDINQLEVDTCRDFKRIVKDYKLDPKHAKRPEYDILEAYCEKGIRFQELVSQSKQRLKDAFTNHIKRYFLSFSQDSQPKREKQKSNIEETAEQISESDEEIKSDVKEDAKSGTEPTNKKSTSDIRVKSKIEVRPKSEQEIGRVKAALDYDSKIESYTTKIDEHFVNLDESLEQFWDLKCPFVGGYLGVGPRVAGLMEKLCHQLTEICLVIRRWTQDDKRYAGRLWDEIISSNVNRARITEETKKVQRRKEDADQQRRRREIIYNKITTKVDGLKREQHKTKTSHDNLQEHVDRMTAESNTLNATLCDHENNIKNRKSNSPRYLEMMWQKCDNIKRDLARVDERKEAFTRQKERMSKTMETQQSEIDAVDRDLQNHKDSFRALVAKIAELDQTIQDLHTQQQTTEAKIAAARKIREIKLSPSTLRKIYYQRMGMIARDELGDACKLVSRVIGNQWRDLYLQLNFLPPRDQEKRLSDVNNVYNACLHKDQGTHEQAWQALLKWRVFHRHGNVNELTRSLRKINKGGIAQKLEHTVSAG